MTRRILTVAGVLMLLLPGPALALQILAPVAGTVVTPGASVHVVVVPSASEPVEEVAVMLGAAAIKAVPAASVPGAFEADVLVPLDAVGRALIVVLARLSDRGAVLEYVAVEVNPGPLERLAFSAPPSMTFVGQLFALDVAGIFRDGVVRNLTDSETGTTYTSTDDIVLGVHPSGLLQARTRGVAIVVVTNRGVEATATVNVQVPEACPSCPPINHIPIPNAGPDRVVAPERVVLLSAAASLDPDGDPLEYRWAQLSGEAVALRDDSSLEASFISPRVQSDEVLEFSLVVIDSRGATSFPAIVRVTVRP